MEMAASSDSAWTELIDQGRFKTRPCLAQLILAQLRVWPEHDRYLVARFAAEDEEFLDRTEEVAALAHKLIGDRVDEYCRDYSWMCANFLEEELYFRRHHRYRHSSFAAVDEAIYSRRDYMSRYVNGILLSLIFWRNHAQSLDFYRTQFLPLHRSSFRHLEVGPGHGLYLAFAARDRNCGEAVGWDISDSSIAATREALKALGIDGPNLLHRDIMEMGSGNEQFDSIVASEILEHLEDPLRALCNLRSCLAPGGRMFLNVPVNSPAPDHIYLWSAPEEVERFVAQAGLEVERVAIFPITGYSIERARVRRAGISTVIIARHRS